MPTYTCHPMIADAEYTLCVEYDYKPGNYPVGPSWACAGEPADGPDIEIKSLRLFAPDIVSSSEPEHQITYKRGEERDVPALSWLAYQLEDYVLANHFDDMLAEVADEQSGPDPDEAYERARDDKAEAGR